MKRVRLSLLGGMLIPPTYAGVVVIIGFIFSAAASTVPVGSKWYWLLCLPLEWAGDLYNRLYPPEGQIFGELRVQVYLINLIADCVGSGMLTYFMLWVRKKRNSRPQFQETDLPPGNPCYQYDHSS